MPDLFQSGVISTAELSPCGRYRYTLTRQWDSDKPRVCWIMCNPSTADAEQDDPTIRRCIGYSKRWGLGGLVVVNLFALRATDPRELYKATDPVGPDNDAALQRATDPEYVVRVLAGWGTHGALRKRGEMVKAMLQRWGRTVECLALTKHGHPKHPLYCRGIALPMALELCG